MGKERFSITRDSVFAESFKFKKKFSAIYPEFSHLSSTDMLKIIKCFNKRCVIEEVISNRIGVELPQLLGVLRISTFKTSPDHKILDFNETKKQGVRVYHHNFDTDSTMGKLLFRNDMSRHSIESNKVWGFVPDRTFKRTVSKTIKNNYKLFEYND